MDAFYTPTWLAATVAELSNSSAPSVVGDFAVGSGVLLDAARCRWPAARFVGTDIDKRAVDRLRRHRPSWAVGRCDFLDGKSRSRCRALRGASCDLILLNPPFSCRGGRRETAFVGEVEVRASIALAFCINALNYITEGGAVVAIVPASTLDSEKDAAAWNVLRQGFECDVLSHFDRNTFDGAYLETVVVRITQGQRRKSRTRPQNRSMPLGPNGRILVYRGKLPRHRSGARSSQDGLTYVHTTNLTTGLEATPRVARDHAWVRGPALLIPRVGRPRKPGLLILQRDHRVVLSDCLFALQTKSIEQALALRVRLHLEWDRFMSAYIGSGAKYLTVRRLLQLLEGLGYLTEVVSSPRWRRTLETTHAV